MGDVSESRTQILLNTLDDELSKNFDVSPSSRSQGGELEVVRNLFQLQIIEEDGDIQLSLRWIEGDNRKVETDICRGCKTIELNEKLEGLVEMILGRNVVKKSYEKNQKEYIGTLKYYDGSIYVGELKDGKRDGQGTLTWSDGGRNIGEFKNDKPWNNIEYDKNGNIIGRIVNGKWVTGEQVWGVLYRGSRNGKLGWYEEKWDGVENNKNIDYGKYEGGIKEGKRNGQGTYTWSDGSKYVGEWKDGKMWIGTEYDQFGNITGKVVDNKFIKQ